MVVIQLKKGEELLLNYSTPASTNIAKLTADLANLNNDRKRLERLISGKGGCILLSYQRLIGIWTGKVSGSTRVF
jgi:hypothetical protein